MKYIKPKRIFEDSGVVVPGSAYHVNLENVVSTKNQDVKTMVDQGRYFSIFAPRQSGKTTFLENMCSELSKDNAYIPIVLSFQEYKTLKKERFYAVLQKEVCTQLSERVKAITTRNEDLAALVTSHQLTDHIAFREFFESLNIILPSKKTVVFIDEFDGIPIDELENFLTTLRELYQKYKKKKEKALHSVGLLGIRNVTKLIVGGVSPFNIADQVSLPPFTLKNIRDLYGQYTDDTNQPFDDASIQKIFNETAGQPWLVNRLATILTVDIKPATVDPITEKDVDTAIEKLLYEENSHFDNLTEKAAQYKEAFIDIVFNGVDYIPGNEIQSLLLTHGLIKAKDKKAVAANALYKKRFLKTFFRDVEVFVDTDARRYYLANDRLNMTKVLADFEKYIAQIGVTAFYATKNPMEATGKFLLTAWLYQFVTTGKGDLHYESRTGLGIMDVMLIYGNTKYIIETKINRYSGTIDDALEQIAEKYLLPQRVTHGYVVLFDPKTKVGELCTPREHCVDGKVVISFNIGIGKTN